ncbi:MAG: LexA family transcriptional regulator [Reichenbachiella sp.]
MSRIGKNIKKIRTVKSLSQTQFGELFGLNRGAVGAYEEERAEPKIETLIQIANHFRLSIDLLLTKELTVNDLYKFNILNKKLDKAHHFDEEEQKTMDPKGICLVKIEKELEYLVNRSNKDFISNLPTINVPNTSEATHRAFELKGSEMEYNQNGLHHGDILVCEALNLKNVEIDKIYLFITNEGFSTRRLSTNSKGVFKFRSDDVNYPSLERKHKEILEIWEVIGAYSSYLNPPKMIEERVMLIESQLKTFLSKK